MRDPAGAGGRQPFQINGKEQDQQQTDEEGRDRQSQQSEDFPRVVPEAADMDRGQDAGGNAQYQGKSHGGGGEGQRVWQAGQIKLENRGLIIKRIPQIAAQQAEHEQQILLPDRPVEAEFVLNGRDIRGAGAGLGEQAGRVAGQADEQEDGERQQHERQQGIAHPPQDILFHVSSIPFWPLPFGHCTLAGALAEPRSDNTLFGGRCHLLIRRREDMAFDQAMPDSPRAVTVSPLWNFISSRGTKSQVRRSFDIVQDRGVPGERFPSGISLIIASRGVCITL